MSDHKRILFVDDDHTILQALRRMLRSMREKWHTEFAESGPMALKLMEKSSFDMVVTDMRMPEMDGAQFLNEVKRMYPDTIRIILSGQAEDQALVRAAGSMHQFLSKPCEFNSLKTFLEKTFSLRNLLTNPDLKKLISQIKSLPVLPKLYVEIMEELESPDASIEKVGMIIEQDIGMSSKILQLANSAFFGFSQKIATPFHAAQILGLDTITSLVLSHQLFSKFQKDHIKYLSIDRLWRHSLRVGELARKMEKMEKLDSNSKSFGFTAGLVHDIGKLIMASNFPALYQKTWQLSKTSGLEFWQAEKEVFNSTHAEVGAYLLGLWGIPDPVVEAVAFHHDPSQLSHLPSPPLILVHAADALAYQKEAGPDGPCASKLNMDFLEKVGWTDRLSKWRDLRTHE
ncbi:MAG: HDOD domain-containing protein [Nitrospinaceae bacterium]